MTSLPPQSRPLRLPTVRLCFEDIDGHKSSQQPQYYHISWHLQSCNRFARGSTCISVPTMVSFQFPQLTCSFQPPQLTHSFQSPQLTRSLHCEQSARGPRVLVAKSRFSC